MYGPNPNEMHPMAGFDQVCFIKNTIQNPNIIIGDYTYYEDPEGSEGFEKNNVLCHFPEVGDKLIIGKFCALGKGVRFIMNGGNHRLSGVSTYPFHLFENGWGKVAPSHKQLSNKGDTIIGNDVWIGYEAIIMPGIKIGNGAIVGARAVVSANVPAYTVIAGNPGKQVKERFLPERVLLLEEIAWWDWPIEKITRNLQYIVAGDVEALHKSTLENYSLTL